LPGETLAKTILPASIGAQNIDFAGFFAGMMLLGKSANFQIWSFFKTISCAKSGIFWCWAWGFLFYMNK